MNDPSGTLLATVRKLAAELHARPEEAIQVALDSSLERDLGFDSLGRVELLTRLEQVFGVSLPERVLATAETPRDLLQAVLAATSRDTLLAQPAARGSGCEAAIPAPDASQRRVMAAILTFLLQGGRNWCAPKGSFELNALFCGITSGIRVLRMLL